MRKAINHEMKKDKGRMKLEQITYRNEVSNNNYQEERITSSNTQTTSPLSEPKNGCRLQGTFGLDTSDVGLLVMIFCRGGLC